MRLLEKSNTRNIFSILNEDNPINYEDKKERLIPIGLTDDKAKDVINGVVGQLSDGMWENSPGMERYWKFTSGLDDKGNIVVYNGYERRDQYNGIDRYGIKKYKPHWSYSAFSKMDDTAVKKFFAAKIKQIVKEEGLEWNRNNTEPCSYLDYDSGVTVRDAYRVYDRLLGRIDRIKESMIPNSKDDNFSDTVKRDFKLFLLDKYDDEQYSDVTEDDVNDYFTGMFYDIWDNDDMESANKAEEIIRNEYGLTESINESFTVRDPKDRRRKVLIPDELENFLNSKQWNRILKILSKYSISRSRGIDNSDYCMYYYFDLNGFDPMTRLKILNDLGVSRDDAFMGDLEGHGHSQYEWTKLVNNIPLKFSASDDFRDFGIKILYKLKEVPEKDYNITDEDKEDYPAYYNYRNAEREYDKAFSEYSRDNSEKNRLNLLKAKKKYQNALKKWNRVYESVKLDEAKKPKDKKEDKRVVMQQGNVTCIKENDSYLVFENEADNEVEHDSEESAMQDFLERVGVNPENELKDE